MTVSVQEKIEQIKHKKYAYQWDIFLRAPAGSVDTSFDRMIIAFADMFDHLSSGPTIQRPLYLGKGGKEIYTIDFSLLNAWGNGLFFHFGEPSGNPRDGYYGSLWCEFVGIADTRLFIEQCADVYSRTIDEKVMMVQPATGMRVTLATNQGWVWQEMMWHVIRERLNKEGYTDETLHLQSRVKLFDALRQMEEKDVYEKLFQESSQNIIDALNHPKDFDRNYFTLRFDQYSDMDETIKELKDPGRIRSIDIASLELVVLPASIALCVNAKDVYAEGNAFTVFPDQLVELKQTEKLLLGYNQITAIPPTIAQLQGLTFLNLNNNQITELPKEIGSLQNLEVLLIAYNQLTSLPETCGKLKRLRTLRLVGNPLPDEEIDRLKQMLPDCYIDNEKSRYEKMLEQTAAKYRQPTQEE